MEGISLSNPCCWACAGICVWRLCRRKQIGEGHWGKAAHLGTDHFFLDLAPAGLDHAEKFYPFGWQTEAERIAADEALANLRLNGINNWDYFGEQEKNLKAIAGYQARYFQLHQVYADGPFAFSLMGWRPDQSQGYAYFCGSDYWPNERMDLITDDQIIWPGNIRPGSSASGFTCMAVGNVDFDPELDYWYINDAGEIKNIQEDYSLD